jgi:hypothetical protein
LYLPSGSCLTIGCCTCAPAARLVSSMVERRVVCAVAGVRFSYESLDKLLLVCYNVIHHASLV